MENMRVESATPGVARVIGEIDRCTALLLRAALEPLVVQGPPVVLDLCRVDFMGSAGVAELVRIDERIGGKLTIIGASAAVSRVLGAAGLTARFVRPAQ